MKTKILRLTQPNKRGFAGRWGPVIVCFALLPLGETAFANHVNSHLNYDFASARLIPAPGYSTIGLGNNCGTASLEPGEPSPYGGGHSDWYVWTPTNNAPFQIDTYNSLIDTALAIYTGGTVSNLTLVQANDDDGTNVRGWSRLALNVIAGTTYYIQVTSKTNATLRTPDCGLYELHWNRLAPSTNTNNLVLTVQTNGPGRVSKSPPGPGYATNQLVTITAIPAAGAIFIGWGGDAASFGTNNPITIVMNSSKVVTANFVGISPSLTYAREGNSLVLTWPEGWSLQMATNLIAPYLDVPEATSPYTIDTTQELLGFFRLRQGTP